MNRTVDFWETYLYREVWHITKLSPEGEVMRTKTTGKYIHTDDIAKLPEHQRNMMFFGSISTSVIAKAVDGKITIPIYEECK